MKIFYKAPEGAQDDLRTQESPNYSHSEIKKAVMMYNLPKKYIHIFKQINYRDSGPRGCFESSASIAENCGTSVRTVGNAIKALKDKNLLIIMRNKGRTHHRRIYFKEILDIRDEKKSKKTLQEKDSFLDTEKTDCSAKSSDRVRRMEYVINKDCNINNNKVKNKKTPAEAGASKIELNVSNDFTSLPEAKASNPVKNEDSWKGEQLKLNHVKVSKPLIAPETDKEERYNKITVEQSRKGEFDGMIHPKTDETCEKTLRALAATNTTTEERNRLLVQIERLHKSNYWVTLKLLTRGLRKAVRKEWKSPKQNLLLRSYSSSLERGVYMSSLKARDWIFEFLENDHSEEFLEWIGQDHIDNKDAYYAHTIKRRSKFTAENFRLYLKLFWKTRTRHKYYVNEFRAKIGVRKANIKGFLSTFNASFQNVKAAIKELEYKRGVKELERIERNVTLDTTLKAEEYFKLTRHDGSVVSAGALNLKDVDKDDIHREHSVNTAARMHGATLVPLLEPNLNTDEPLETLQIKVRGMFGLLEQIRYAKEEGSSQAKNLLKTVILSSGSMIERVCETIERVYSRVYESNVSIEDIIGSTTTELVETYVEKFDKLSGIVEEKDGLYLYS